MEVGLTYTCSTIVEEKHLAINVGSGDMRVLATPAMIALMEQAAMMAVTEHLPEGCTTVGGYIGSSHIKPTALGKKISATAILTKAEGKKLTFSIKAEDEEGTIGEGEHIRFIVDRKKFMGRIS